MRTRIEGAILARLILGAMLASSIAWGPPVNAQPAPKTASAAEEFDTGVRHFEAAEYAAAARAFLRADILAQNSEAIANAMVAARRANDHLLTAEAALRGVARQAADPGLAAKARVALAEAAQHLAQLELSCSPTPCSLSVDGATLETERRFLLPGTHQLIATGPNGARAEQTQMLAAGTTYRIELHPIQPGATQQAADIHSAPHSAPEPTADSERDEPGAPASDSRKQGWSPAVFYTGIAVTSVLAGVTIWSGLNTLSAKDGLPDPPLNSERDEVQAKALRTDLLLAGSVVAAGLTTFVGLKLVDWKGGRTTAQIVPASSGAMVMTQGRF